MGTVEASVVAGLIGGGIAVVLAIALNWLRRPNWATTGRLITIVIICIVLGALVPVLFSNRVSVSDVTGQWTKSSAVSAFEIDVALTISEDGNFDFAMTLNVSNPPLDGSGNYACAGIASSDGDSVALRATSGSCPGLSVKPGPSEGTLDLTGANNEPMTLTRAG